MRHVQKFAWVVLVAAIGCGGDDSGDDTGSSGSGGSAAGTGGSAAGTGGSAAGTGGGMAADPVCVQNVIDRSGETDQMQCAECVCKANETATNACDEACWDLVLCIRDKCMGDANTPGMPDRGPDCYTAMCMDELTAGSATATPFQSTIEGCLDSGDCSTE